MAMDFRQSDPSTELVAIIRQVRRRWRMKLALRGALGVVGLGLIVLVLSAWGLESWRFTPASIITFRIVLGASVLALTAYLLIRPLMQQASDEQVALYLEEHEPSLQAEIISAIEAGRLAQGSASPHSAALVQRLIESAIEKVRAIEDGRRVERLPVRKYAATLAAVAAAAAVLFTFGPAYLRHALSALLVVSRDVEAAAPYRIEVTPGNASVPRGADQTITAHLSGFDADQASLMVRKTPESPFERVALVRGENGAYEGHAVRPGRAARLLRRGRRRALAGLHTEGRRPALRLPIGARVSLPGLHRAASRRRSRTAATSRCSRAPRSASARFPRWRPRPDRSSSTTSPAVRSRPPAPPITP